MKKRFKTKRRFKSKSLFLVFLVIISFYVTLSLLLESKLVNREDVIKYVIAYITNDNILINKLKDNITSPEKIMYSSFNKAVTYDDIKVFKENRDLYFDYDNASSEYVYETDDIKVEEPLIYIYNTHQLEEYAKNVNSEHSVSPNVMIASYTLKEKLIEKGIGTIVETGNIKSYLNKNNMNYYQSYDASRYYALKELKKHDSILYVIDLHRDAIKKSLSTVTYNNKKYAKVMFVVGLGNPGYKYNLNLAKELNMKFEAKVPGITRSITKYPGNQTNAVYNQDLSRNAILIEVGGYENMIEEVNNTLDVFADILYQMIRE